MQTNNKLREALESVKELARTIYSTSDKGSSHEDLAEKIVELANAALAAPARNCDVGTAQEQDEPAALDKEKRRREVRLRHGSKKIKKKFIFRIVN